jgi:hypothetical protein
VSGLSSRRCALQPSSQRLPGPPAIYIIKHSEALPETYSLTSAASRQSLQAFHAFNCLLIKSWEDIGRNNLVVGVLVQGIYGDKILIPWLIFQLGSELPKEIKELPGGL